MDLLIIIPLVISVGAGLAAAGIASLIGGLVSSWFSNKAQREANATNIQLANLNNAANERNIDKQNEYNSPINQVSRLSAAGLNPNLAYGNGQVMNTQDSPAQFVAPHVDPAGMDFTAISGAANSVIDNFLKFRATEIDQQNADSNSQNAGSNSRNAASNAKNADTKAEEVRREQERKDKEFEVKKLNWEAQRALLEEQTDNLHLTGQEKRTFLTYYDELCRAQLDAAKLAPSEIRAKIEKIRQDALTSGANSGMLDALAEKYRTEIFDLMPETIKNLKSERGLIDSNVQLNEAKIQEINKGIEKMDAEIKKIAAETNLTEKEIKYYFYSRVALPTANTILDVSNTVIGAKGSFGGGKPIGFGK